MTPAQRAQIMPHEVHDTVNAYLAGKIDQWYFRADGKGVVFIVNASTPEAPQPENACQIRGATGEGYGDNGRKDANHQGQFDSTRRRIQMKMRITICILGLAAFGSRTMSPRENRSPLPARLWTLAAI
jgi:hypothetical protein